MSKIEVNAIEPQCGTDLTVGASGDTITFPTGTTIVNNGTQTGFGRTGTVDWQTSIKTGDFTAVSGEGYFVNTTSGAITMTLPASPSAGAIVSVKDYAQTFDTNILTVGRNGSNFNGGSDFNPTFSTEGAFLTFIYADATKGWLVTDASSDTTGASNTFIVATGGTITTVDTDYKVHTFTGPGSFEVTAGTGTVAVADYVVVAGGGSGAPTNHGAGGGAGGFRESHCATTSGPYTASPLASPTSIPFSIGSFPITVGAGGTAPPAGSPPKNGTQGSNSILSTITSAGGGGGTTGDQNPVRDGGSGGGMNSTCGTSYQGSGNTPPVSPPQGNNGGAIPGGASGPAYGAGGGGGAGAVGGTGTGSVAGVGGVGVTTSITGAAVTRGGGGGGSIFCGPAPSPTSGGGGTGGGGAGGRRSSTIAVAGTANTGGGGGGAERCTPNDVGGAGGSGIVIIRYKFQ